MKVYFMDSSVKYECGGHVHFETNPRGIYTTIELALEDAHFSGCDIPVGDQVIDGKPCVVCNADRTRYMTIYKMTVIDH